MIANFCGTIGYECRKACETKVIFNAIDLRTLDRFEKSEQNSAYDSDMVFRENLYFFSSTGQETTTCYLVKQWDEAAVAGSAGR